MLKYRSFGETNLKYGIFSKTNFERNERKKEKKWWQISNKKNSVGQFWQGQSGKGKHTYF
jgi:hypothetical protein